MQNKLNFVPAETRSRKRVRKSKAYGLVSGLVLVGALGVSGVVSANEVVGNTDATQGATNLTGQQGTVREDKDIPQNTNTGAITVPVESTTLNDAVADAKAKGVEIVTNADAQVPNLSEADRILNRQETNLETVTQNQVELNKQIDDAEKKATDAGLVVEKQLRPDKHANMDSAKNNAQNTVNAINNAVTTKTQIDQQVATAKTEAEQKGIKVELNLGNVTTSDTRGALHNIQQQLARLDALVTTKEEKEASLALAIEDAKKKGITVNVASTTKVTNVNDLIKAFADAETYITNLENVKASTESRIRTVVERLKQKGITVTTNGTVNSNAAELATKSQEVITALTEIENLQTQYNNQVNEIVRDGFASGVSVTSKPVVTVATTVEADRIIADNRQKVNKAIQDYTGGIDDTDRANDALISARNTANQAINAEVTKARQAGVSVYDVNVTKLDTVPEVQQHQKTATDSLAQAIRQATELATQWQNTLRNAQAQGLRVIQKDRILDDYDGAKRSLIANDVAIENAKTRIKLLDTQYSSLVNAGAQNGVKVDVSGAGTYDQASKTVGSAIQAVSGANTKIDIAIQNAQRAGVKVTVGGNEQVAVGNLATRADQIVAQLNRAKDNPTEFGGETFDAINGQAQSEAPRNGEGYTNLNSTTHFKAQVIGEGANRFEVVSAGNLASPQIHIKPLDGSNLDDSMVIRRISWSSSVAPEGANLQEGHNGWQGKAYDYSQVRPWTGKIKTWYRIADAIQLANGNTEDLYVQFDTNTIGLDNQGDDTVVFWSADGAVSVINGYRVSSPNTQGDGVRTTFSVGNPNDPNRKKYIWATSNYDIDLGQKFSVDKNFSSVALLAVGGGVKYDRNSGTVQAHEYLGITPDRGGFGKGAHELNGLVGRASAPDGSAITVGYGHLFSSLVFNTGANEVPRPYENKGHSTVMATGGASSEVDYIYHIPQRITVPKLATTVTVGKPTESVTLQPVQLFMTVNKVEVELQDIPNRPRVEVQPVRLTANAPTLAVTSQVEKPAVESEIVVPTIKVASKDLQMQGVVQPLYLQTTPTNVKRVTDLQGNSIDGQMVPKGATVVWELNDGEFVAGRDKALRVTRHDPIPQGFELNIDLTKQMNPLWDIHVILNGQTVTGVSAIAKKELQDAMNADLTKAYTLPKTFLVGKALYEDAVYKNTFTTNIVWEDMKIVNGVPVSEKTQSFTGRTSNLVKVLTPNDTNPSKAVTNNPSDLALNIDGKKIPYGDKVNYVLRPDYAKYKGISASVTDIAKGFAIVDDYPEEVLNFDEDDTLLYIGGTNTPLTTYFEQVKYDALADATQAHKDLVTNAGLNPKGAFVLYAVKQDKLQDYFNNVVKAGLGVRLVTGFNQRLDVIKQAGESTYANKVMSIEFGNGYNGNFVTNTTQIPDPDKVNKDTQGNVINDKSLTIGSVNHYELAWKFDAHKDAQASTASIRKGFHFFDVYPKTVVTASNSGATLTFVDDNSKVTGVSVNTYEDMNTLPEPLKSELVARGLKLDANKGIQVFSADNPEQFFRDVVQKGRNIKIVSQMPIKPTVAGLTEYKNIAYQYDFGQLHTAEEVTNKVGVPDPSKRNHNKDGQDIDGLPMLVGMTNVWDMTWNLEPYKNAVSDETLIAKGFYFADDLPEVVTVEPKAYEITVDGKSIVGDIVFNVYPNVDVNPEAKPVVDLLKAKGVSIKDKAVIISAKDPKAFFDKYVKAGKNISVKLFTTVAEPAKKVPNYSNIAYQIEFGNVYATERVGNYVPTPTPDKTNKNLDGQVIDGTPTPVGMDMNYDITWSFRNHKGLKASKSEINNGFYLVEDIPEDVLAVRAGDPTIQTKEATPRKVEGVTYKFFDKLESAPVAIQNVLKGLGILPTGAFQLFSADNPEQFFTNYVQKGIDLSIINPTTVKMDVKGKAIKFENKVTQIDFKQAYAVTPVVNEVPVPEPKKDNYDANGVLVNDKVLFAGDTNYYRLTWDLSDYKGVKADKTLLTKPFALVDIYTAGTLEPVEGLLSVNLLDANGKYVGDDLVSQFEVTKYASVEDVPANLKSILGDITKFDGKSLQILTPKDANDFVTKYVVTGAKLGVINPMKVDEKLFGKEAKYTNEVVQIDFGTAYYGNIVTNEIPKLEVAKDVKVKDASVDGKVIKLGEEFVYVLKGATLPANRGTKVHESTLYDDYDQEHDEYLGKFNITANVDFKLQLFNEDGSKGELKQIKAGDDLAEYFLYVHDEKLGAVIFTLSDKYLDSFLENEPFGYDVTLFMKRIKSGEKIENNFTQSFNGKTLVSNTVVTSTPEPEKPEEPKKPTPPPAPKHSLPKTGSTSELGTILTGLAMASGSLGLASLKRKKRK